MTDLTILVPLSEVLLPEVGHKGFMYPGEPLDLWGESSKMLHPFVGKKLHWAFPGSDNLVAFHVKQPTEFPPVVFIPRIHYRTALMYKEIYGGPLWIQSS